MEKIRTHQRPIDGCEELSQTTACLEHLMLGLRTPDGVDFSSFPGDRGPAIRQANLRLIDDLLTGDLGPLDDNRLRPTLAGLAVAESIARQFDLLECFSPEGEGIC